MSEFTYEKILKAPKIIEMIKKAVLRSNMIDSVEMVIKEDTYAQFTGKNPFTLLWYAKIVACMLSISKYH